MLPPSVFILAQPAMERQARTLSEKRNQKATNKISISCKHNPPPTMLVFKRAKALFIVVVDSVWDIYRRDQPVNYSSPFFSFSFWRLKSELTTTNPLLGGLGDSLALGCHQDFIPLFSIHLQKAGLHRTLSKPRISL